MIRFVLDCSLAMTWAFADQRTGYGQAILHRLKGAQALVPPLFALEIANALVVGERRQRLTPTDSTRFVDLIRHLPIVVDNENVMVHLDETLSLARAQSLSAYDAAYLRLAMREGLTLATLDGALTRAAEAVGVRLTPADEA